MKCQLCKKEILKVGMVSDGKTYHLECFKKIKMANKDKAKKVFI